MGGSDESHSASHPRWGHHRARSNCGCRVDAVAKLESGSYLAACGGTYSWDDFVATLNALGHDLRVVRVAPEVFDGFFPVAKELREMYEYFEAHTYFGPDAQTAIAAARALVSGGFTDFSDWARKNNKPGG